MRHFNLIFLVLLVFASLFLQGCIAVVGGLGAAYLGKEARDQIRGDSCVCRNNFFTRSAIKGYDLVELLDGHLIEGNSNWFIEEKNAVFYFKNQENLSLFLQNKDEMLKKLAFFGNAPDLLPEPSCGSFTATTILIQDGIVYCFAERAAAQEAKQAAENFEAGKAEADPDEQEKLQAKWLELTARWQILWEQTPHGQLEKQLAEKLKQKEEEQNKKEEVENKQP